MVDDKKPQSISPMQAVMVTAANSEGAVGVSLNEDKCLGYVNLRLKPDDDQSIQSAKTVLGVDLPAINQRVSHNKHAILGLGPSEWLIICAEDEALALVAQLTEALGAGLHLVCDVSGGTTQLNIKGAHAQDVLETGTYVDLHDSVLKPDRLYATQVAHAPAIIIKNAPNDFSLIVRRSFADHLARWGVDAATEYGGQFS